MKRALLTILLISTAPRIVGAQEPPKAPTPDEASVVHVPVMLTPEEGRALYELGVTTGMTQAAMQTAQAKAKSAIDKLK